MTSHKLDSNSCNTLGLSDGCESLESGIGEGEYESDVFEACLEEVGDLREDSEVILEAFSDKLFISPTSSSSTQVTTLLYQQLQTFFRRVYWPQFGYHCNKLILFK